MARPCSSMTPQPEQRWRKIQSLPYGQPFGAVLWSRPTPFRAFFTGGLAWVPLSCSAGRFPLALPPAATSSSATSKGSGEGSCPGKHGTYCQGSPEVHDRSADAANSIRNCISYSSHASWFVAFCWRRSTVCRCATMLGTMSAAFLESTAMYRIKQQVHHE